MPKLSAVVLIWLTLPASARNVQVHVLYGPDAASPTIEERAVAAYNLQAVQHRGAPIARHVELALGDLGDVIRLGGGEAAVCPGSPITVGAFKSGLDKASEHLEWVEPDEASAELDRLRSLLPCLSEVLPREELARIGFLDGVARAYADDEDGARSRYREALGISPELSWDGRFAPRYEPTFTQAYQDALRAAKGRIAVSPRLGQTAVLWVDGQEFSVEGGTATLAAGSHLLQWRSERSGFETQLIRIEADEELSLSSPFDVAQAAVSGAGSAPLHKLAEAALAAFGEAEQVDEVYLVEFGGVDLLHRFVVATGAWELADEGLAVRRLRARTQRTAGTVSIIAGSVLAATGTVMGIVGYREALTTHGEAEQCKTTETYNNLVEQYANQRAVTYAGIGIGVVGGAAVLFGIPLRTTADRLRRSRAAAPASVELRSASLRPTP